MIKEYLRFLTIGMTMGAAEVVPGVSGGTIAFVTGIYQRMLESIRQFHPKLLLDLKKNGIVATWHQVDANFMLVLFGGMGISILLLARGVSYMLAEQPIFIWSFFFGLVLGSVVLVVLQIQRFNLATGLCIGVGIACGLVVAYLVPVETEPELLTVFLGGAIAVCAWVLPGLSGSYILLVLGLYRFVIEAIKGLDVLFLGALAAGCAVGIVAFANLLTWLLKHFRDQTLAVLIGFMVGSLVKLWPWRHVLSYQLKSDGSHVPLVEEPVSPMAYAELTGLNPDWVLALIGLLVGGVAVLGLNAIAVRHVEPENR